VQRLVFTAIKDLSAASTSSAAPDDRSPGAVLLSPFDNLIFDRAYGDGA
jgi:hypothetical protein